MVALTMPVLYLGTLLGVQINTYLSSTVLAISIGLTLLFMSYTVYKKAMKSYQDENIKMQKEQGN